MANQGYIKLFRSIEDWEWIDDPVMFYFWGRILIMANWEDTKYRGSVVERGSFLTSYRSLAEILHLSLRQVRTCVERLKQCGQIIVKSTHFPTQFATQVIICNYDTYQDADQVERHSSRQTGDTVATQLGTPPSSTPLSSTEKEEQEKKKVVDTIVSPRKEKVDYQAVLDLWNSNAKRSVPKIKAVTPARRDKVKLRIEEMGGWESAKVTLAECFTKISASDFCNGATGKWVATFDWFFDNGKNWVKVLEGNYDNRKEKSQLEVLAENVAKAHEYYGRQYGYGGASAYGNPAGGRQDSPDEQ